MNSSSCLPYLSSVRQVGPWLYCIKHQSSRSHRLVSATVRSNPLYLYREFFVLSTPVRWALPLPFLYLPLLCWCHISRANVLPPHLNSEFYKRPKLGLSDKELRALNEALEDIRHILISGPKTSILAKRFEKSPYKHRILTRLGGILPFAKNSLIGEDVGV